MLLKIDTTDESPLYGQIAAALRRSIASGDVAEGDRLPSARDLAVALDVNMHTVLRAYAELSDEGIVEVRRGRGSIVSQGAASMVDLIRITKELVSEARRLGLNSKDLIALIRQEMP